jgi:hypothetical protein
MRRRTSNRLALVWEDVAKAAKEVEGWPAWKRGESTVATTGQTSKAEKPPKTE